MKNTDGILSTALIALLSTGCGSRNDNERSERGVTERRWTEDVVLDDGSTLVVSRVVAFRETNSWSGDAYNAVEKSASLAFTGTLANLPVWNRPLLAQELHKDPVSGEWVLIATTTSCDVWNDRGAPRVMYLPDRPDTLYWEFRLNADGWYEVPLSRSSVGRTVNLLFSYEEPLGTNHVTVAFRKERESDIPAAKRFRVIGDRYAVHCGPSIQNSQVRKAQDVGNITEDKE